MNYEDEARTVDWRQDLAYFQGETTLQPIRSKGAASRVTTRYPRERAIAAMRDRARAAGL
jgi:hypothetical protein